MPREDKEGRNRSEYEEEESEDGKKSEHRGQKSDLDEREYTDAEGNVHHHTKKYMEGNEGE